MKNVIMPALFPRSAGRKPCCGARFAARSDRARSARRAIHGKGDDVYIGLGTLILIIILILLLT
jgi:hypothetical protein